MATSRPRQVPPLNDPIVNHARRDYLLLKENLTVQQALDTIRAQGVGDRIIYFYVVDEQDRLAGVLPTRRLLLAPVDMPLSQLMVSPVIAIPHTATVLEAFEFFVLHRFLAFPIVDEKRHVVGLVDVAQFSDEVFDLAERDQANALFETLGFHVEQLRGAGAVKAFRYRFPWLTVTIVSGTLCALLTGAFELTLEKSLVLAFFLALVLGLGESVSMQSMAVTVQALQVTQPTLTWYLGALRREAMTALLLGSSCGATVALIVLLWKWMLWPALVIGLSIVLALQMACCLGLTIPWLVHVLRLDPRIAAGPITLACADLATLLFYFTLATLLL